MLSVRRSGYSSSPRRMKLAPAFSNFCLSLSKICGCMRNVANRASRASGLRSALSRAETLTLLLPSIADSSSGKILCAVANESLRLLHSLRKSM
jgi:hypothetical protein